MKIAKPSYLTLAVLAAIVLLISSDIAETNNFLLPTTDPLFEDIRAEFNWIENHINATTDPTAMLAEKEHGSSDTISLMAHEAEDGMDMASANAHVNGQHGRNYDGGYHRPGPVHIDFSPIFLAIVPIALFLGAASAFALATASSSSSSAAAAAQQQQQQQEAANNNNNANNANNNNNNAILAALIAAFLQKGHSSKGKGHKTIIYAYNVTKVAHDHDWRRSTGDTFRFSVPRMKPMSHWHRTRKYAEHEP